MGRNAWESDTSLDKRSGTRWGRVLVWIVIVAAATFAFAYYLPLHQTHRALIEQRRQTQEAARAFEQKLRETEQQLGLLQKQKQELLAERATRDQSQKSAAGRAEVLKKALAGKFAEKTSIGIDGASVLVAIDSRHLFVPSKNELSGAGRTLLCAVAAASEKHPLAVSAISANQAAAGAPSSSWELTALQAAAVAQTLEEKCGIASARLTATGRGPNSGSAGALWAAPPPADRVQIAIETGDGEKR